MRRIETVAALRRYIAAAPRPIGLVPTMGALHAGHISLVDAARDDCRTVVVSIFVNPTQFAADEDLAQYPRPIDRDLAMLRDSVADAAFTPDAAEMYPPGFATTIAVGGPALPLEGAMRPGHFAGVATVVAKLLLAAAPDRAYFGQKDGQQVAVVRRLVRDLHIPVDIVVGPTVREPDGLAMSSRNVYLSPDQRAAAPAVHRGLLAARRRYVAGERDRAALEAACGQALAGVREITRIDYVALVDADTMAPWEGAGRPMLAVAVRMGATRLIDNLLLDGD
ncbi:MAG: pantoate--beta-alanine ligase [SAR202 cluster bacterium]|nr:pantoate--beta-alanine ligase [SAR202 cluster bacterium]